MKRVRYILYIAVVSLLFMDTVLLAQHHSLGRDGYYKDIFMDSGVQLVSRKFLPSARHLQMEVETFWHVGNTLNDTLMQEKCFVGSEMDSNGILLYPDGAPRFKVVYVNGGLALYHARSLGAQGQERFREYVRGGGSYVGTCAGQYIATTGVYRKDGTFREWSDYFALWPGRSRDTFLEEIDFTMYMDETCPLLKYYDFGGDMKVDSIYHCNGGYASLGEGDPVPAGTEPLLRVDWNEPPEVGPSIDNQVCCWAYKPNDNSGRVILMSSHPEAVTTGERLHLMSSFFLYAIDGNGAVKVKGELLPGQFREMTKSTGDKEPLFTKIGDRQYHHFTVEIPKRTKKAIIVLEGYEGANNFDLTLAASHGEFAFHDKAGYMNVDLGCNKELIIENPQAGTWYVSVFCETTVTASEGENGVEYTGRTDVLNGVPYKVKAVLKRK